MLELGGCCLCRGLQVPTQKPPSEARAIVSPFPKRWTEAQMPSVTQLASSQPWLHSGLADPSTAAAVWVWNLRPLPSQRVGTAIQPHASTHTRSRSQAPLPQGLLGTGARCNLSPLEGNRARGGKGNALTVQARVGPGTFQASEGLPACGLGSWNKAVPAG